MDNPLAYPLTEKQKNILREKEMCVHGIPTMVLAKANIFANDTEIVA